MEAGDMIVLPAGMYHRFTLDEANYLKAMRLFVGDPVWTPHNRESEGVDAMAERLAYAAAIGAVGAAAALADAYYWRSTWLHGPRWRCAAIGLLHAKALRLRLDALSAASTGHALSLATNDAERLLQLVHHLPHLVLAPIDTLIYAYFLVADLGAPAGGAGRGLDGKHSGMPDSARHHARWTA
jgi:hypothetical protein